VLKIFLFDFFIFIKFIIKMENLNFALIAIAIVYLIIVIFAALRFGKVVQSKKAIKISYAFYSGMFITALVRAITLYLLSGLVGSVPDKKDLQDNIFFYLLIVTPDMLNICVFLFLAWYYFSHFILSHINLANDIGFFYKYR
jgi:hypothetical protein